MISNFYITSETTSYLIFYHHYLPMISGIYSLSYLNLIFIKKESSSIQKLYFFFVIFYAWNLIQRNSSQWIRFCLGGWIINLVLCSNFCFFLRSEISSLGILVFIACLQAWCQVKHGTACFCVQFLIFWKVHAAWDDYDSKARFLASIYFWHFRGLVIIKGWMLFPRHIWWEVSGGESWWMFDSSFCWQFLVFWVMIVLVPKSSGFAFSSGQLGPTFIYNLIITNSLNKIHINFAPTKTSSSFQIFTPSQFLLPLLTLFFNFYFYIVHNYFYKWNVKSCTGKLLQPNMIQAIPLHNLSSNIKARDQLKNDLTNRRSWLLETQTIISSHFISSIDKIRIRLVWRIAIEILWVRILRVYSKSII